MRSLAVRFARCAAVVSLIAACGAETDSLHEEEGFATAESALVTTFYQSGWRVIHATTTTRNPAWVGAALAYKEGGRCKSAVRAMDLVPAGSATAEICASVNLQLKKVNGVSVCVRPGTTYRQDVWRFNLQAAFPFTFWNIREVNYEVRVFNSRGTVVDRSGWVPGAAYSNRCPRP